MRVSDNQYYLHRGRRAVDPLTFNRNISFAIEKLLQFITCICSVPLTFSSLLVLCFFVDTKCKLNVLTYITQMITGRVEFQGTVKFYSNSALGVDGGAVYLLSFSQLFLQNGLQLEFVNNIGRYGPVYTHTCKYKYTYVYVCEGTLSLLQN